MALTAQQLDDLEVLDSVQRSMFWSYYNFGWTFDDAFDAAYAITHQPSQPDPPPDDGGIGDYGTPEDTYTSTPPEGYEETPVPYAPAPSSPEPVPSEPLPPPGPGPVQLHNSDPLKLGKSRRSLRLEKVEAALRFHSPTLIFKNKSPRLFPPRKRRIF